MSDTTADQTLTIVNEGAGEGSFSIIEMPVTTVLVEQLILDPSFEAYTPNPYWDEYSATFGTPLCTVADCGTGTGTGPRTGSVWSWFGGAAAGDTGSVAQDVQIDPGIATMRFYVEQYVCGDAGASNYLRLEIDGTEIWRTDGTDPACGEFGYREITLDVSEFADGMTHEIMFYSQTVGSGNFFLDDVELHLEPGGDVPWLSVFPESGTVDGDSTTDVTVTFDATDMLMGDYDAILRVMGQGQPAMEVPVTLHVIENEPPVAEDQAVETEEDIPVEITLVATDADGDELTYHIVDLPENGTLEYEPGELPVLTYVPDPDWYGVDTFTFKANDGISDSNIATVTITVTSVNYPPVAVDDYYDVDMNTVLDVPAPGVMANDYDPDPADIMIVELVSGPSHGVLEFNVDGSFVYTPDTDFRGVDSFEYLLISFPPELVRNKYHDYATVYITVIGPEPLFKIFIPMIIN
jgi:hypothetical protein